MHGLLTVRRIPVNVCGRFRVVLLRHRGALGHAGHRVWNLRAGLAVDPLDRHGFRGFRRRDRRSVLVEDKAAVAVPFAQRPAQELAPAVPFRLYLRQGQRSARLQRRGRVLECLSVRLLTGLPLAARQVHRKAAAAGRFSAGYRAAYGNLLRF